MPAVHAFQIFYDPVTRSALDPGFEPLDNSASERPDWYEYWPIRAYLEALGTPEESAFYGFFSPLFFRKTHLTGRHVVELAVTAGEADVVMFPPHPCHGACFFNVFEQAENFFPGFLGIAKSCLQELYPDVRLDAMVNDSRTTLYCNFFVARPRFWNEWCRAFDRVFELAETQGSPLYEALNREVRYVKTDGDTKPMQMKIVLMERIPSLLLASRPFTTKSHPPFAMPLSAAFFGRLPDLVALDALKIAYADTGDREFLSLYSDRRTALLGETLFDVAPQPSPARV
jgi:hypothetical protein